MKKPALLVLAIGMLCCWITFSNARNATGAPNRNFEYLTLRWDGRENTHIVRPGGAVEFLGSRFRGMKKPEHADDRSYFMNVAMDSIAGEGYELVAMTSDDYVFRRDVNSSRPK